MSKVPQHLSCLNFFYPSTQTSDFELYCQQGSLSAIKQLELIDKESLFLKGLFLSIQHQHLEIFHYFIQHPIYLNFILRHFQTLQQHLLDKRSIDFLQQLKNLNPSSQTNQLIGNSLEIALNNLFCFYHSQLSATHLRGQLQRIKNQIANLWHADPPYFQQQALPLSLEDFQQLQTNLSEVQLNRIRKIYFEHPLHICWRLFSPNEIWFENQKEKEQAHFIEQHGWSIILFWLAASDPLNLPKNVDLNLRLNYFFRRLSQIHPNPHELDFFLLRSVIAHPYCQLLDQESLYLEFQNFYTKTQAIHYSDFASFSGYMADKWKHQWMENVEIQEFAKQSFIKFMETPEQLKLGFFHNVKMQSKSPKTMDFFVPLS